MRTLLRITFICGLALSLLAWNGCKDGPVKDYNLIISSGGGADPNGLSLNPLWGYQFEHPGEHPTPQPHPNEPWSSAETDWNIGFDSEWDCTDNTHANWINSGGLRVGTYTGPITWEEHSSPWWDDDDYTFNLIPKDGASLQSTDQRGLHLEYKQGEVGDRFDEETTWWKAFHNAVDHDDVRPTPFDMLTSREAIVTGLLGMDRQHDNSDDHHVGAIEVHPVCALAARVNEDPSDETWALFARNWGNEGYCSDGQWWLGLDTMKILIPWRTGATQGPAIDGTFSIVNAVDEADFTRNVSYTVNPSSGILLSFRLKPQPQDEPDEDGTVIEGEIHLHWNGQVILAKKPETKSSSLPARERSPKHEEPETIVRDLVKKMTPQQQATFFAALPKRRPNRPSHFAKIGSRSEVAAAQSQNPAAIKVDHVRSDFLVRLGQSRRAGLHAVFGEDIPGIVDREKKRSKD